MAGKYHPSFNLAFALIMLVSVFAGAVSPVAAQTGDTEVPSDGLHEWVNFWGTTFEVPDGIDIQTFGTVGQNVPSFMVHYEDGEFSKLDSWVNDSDVRDIKQHDADGDWAVVAAPSTDILDPKFLRADSGLATLSYVKAVQFNARHSVDPIYSLKSSESVEVPTPFFVADKSAPQMGVAFDGDANETTVANSEKYIGIDSTVTATGEDVDVAVLDTGANPSETEYDDQIAAGRDFVDSRGSVNVSAGDYAAIADGHGHGDWTASAIHEIAPNASLHIGRVLGDDGGGTTASIVSGVEWACNAQDVDVLSMSLGSGVYSSAIEGAIEDCEDNDTLVVVAAGNARYQQGVGPASPADSPHTLAVAATNAAAPEDAMSAYFSNVGPDNGFSDLSNGATRGATIDIAAPGMALTAPSGDTMSGTSMSAPEVSASAAIVQEATGLSGSELGERLISTSSPIPNAAASEVGAGMVNVSAAIANEPPETGQEEAMTADAAARDGFNHALGGRFIDTRAFAAKILG